MDVRHHVRSLVAALGLCVALSPAGVAASAPPLRGTLTLEDYRDGASGGSIGIINLSLPGGQKVVLRNGAYPWRHPGGLINFVQGCGEQGASQLALDKDGLTTLLSPCSNTLTPPGISNAFPGRFVFSRLSPDGRRVAAEFFFLTDSGGQETDVLVYDLKGQMLNFFRNRSSPVWFPDGRLAMGGDGIIVTDQALIHPKRLDNGQLGGSRVGNMDVNPAGTQIAFEYNQQIWTLDVKTGTPRRTVTSDVRLLYPTYSPDGNFLAYLGTPQNDLYLQAILFTDLRTGKAYQVPFPVTSLDRPNGPLSWNK